ncbi:hypothetical protein ACSZMF_19825 [Aeromonas caviae]|jgi:hypothetical protein|uniref:hypothetical protein n=1 Tax=Aeromonas caviae TaxID=648 RepID=UPI00021986A8|nr:hypothetical protein [Aeromonas caviae]
MSTSSNLKLALELAAKVNGREDLAVLTGRSAGEVILLTVPRASLAPKKAVDFLSDKPIEIELEGELLALDGETAPFYVDRPETV